MSLTRAIPGLAIPGATYPGFLGVPGARVFRPPTRRNVFSSQDRLWQHFHYDSGLTVLKWPDGSYQTVEEVDPDLLDQVSIAYIGGHEYDVDEAEAAALTAAGYEVTKDA